MMVYGATCNLIRQESNILEFCEDYYGSVFIENTKNWHNTNCLIPDHVDNNPSFGVNTESNMFKCFGCGASGSIIDLVMKVENMTLTQSINFLLEYLNINTSEYFNEFYKLHKMLNSDSNFYDKDVFLDAKILNLKNNKNNFNDHFKNVTNLFSAYDTMDFTHFQNFVMNNK